MQVQLQPCYRCRSHKAGNFLQRHCARIRVDLDELTGTLLLLSGINFQFDNPRDPHFSAAENKSQ